jgi:hypothetical protein
MFGTKLNYLRHNFQQTHEIYLVSKEANLPLGSYMASFKPEAAAQSNFKYLKRSTVH